MKRRKRAVVIDPRRDIAPYLDAADSHDLSIDWVLENPFPRRFCFWASRARFGDGSKDRNIIRG